jgi:hypothetical protein
VTADCRHRATAFPAFSDPPRPWHAVCHELMWGGFLTFLGTVYYHAPGAVLLGAGAFLRSAPLAGAGAIVWLAATALVPGYMTHYCANRDVLAILNPLVGVADSVAR